MLIQAAEGEVLVDDAKRLANAARAGGVDVTLQLYPERLHIFSLFPFLESSKRSLESLAEFAKPKRSGALSNDATVLGRT